jgi:chaperone BCS1
MMTWISSQAGFRKSHDVEIITRRDVFSGMGDMSGQSRHDDEAVIRFLPSPHATYSLWYKRRWMQITRTKSQGGGDYWNAGRSQEDRLEIKCVLSSILLSLGVLISFAGS